MNIDLTNATLPPIYSRNHRACYLDPVREKLIFITPEETVRQKIISYLIEKLNVPKNMIIVEALLSSFGLKSRGRADIVILQYRKEENTYFPLAVIECKAPGILLGDRATQQMIDYADKLACDYCMMTDGNEAYCYHYQEDTNSYDEISALPEYSGMVQGEYVKEPEPEFPPRIPFQEIPKCEHKYRNMFIGTSTPNHLACPAVNLLEALLYTEHKFPAKQYKLFRVIEDYGIRNLSYGNNSGGYFAGEYRSFLIDYRECTEFVSLGLSTYCTGAHPEIIQTNLNVAIDNEKTSHHSLQYVIDKNMSVLLDKVTFYHDGRIAVGNIGSGKVSELKALVRKLYPSIISKDQICLGSLRYDRQWNLDDPEVMDVIENFISYALIRDEYRKHLKDRK